MKTIYGLYWIDEDDNNVVEWFTTEHAADVVYKDLQMVHAIDLCMFKFYVEDNATEDEIDDVVGDFLLGRTHLADLDATVLQ